MLNRLRKHKDSKVIDAIRLIIDGKAQDPLLVEIAILNSLMNHPEHYIKNIDPETKRTIQNEIKVTLETFILELNDEVVSSKPGVRA
ncbi:hypothetical protein [Legionella sp. WA2022007384]